MLAKRIIPCLDVTGGRVVKGVNFVELRAAGDPVALTSTSQTVLALSSTNNNVLITGGPIVSDIPTRLVVNAAVETFIGSTNGGLGRASCVLRLSTNGATSVQIGNGKEVTFEEIVPQAARFRNIALVATTDVPAGSHDVSISCSRFDRSDLSIQAPITARDIDLSVLALRQS